MVALAISAAGLGLSAYGAISSSKAQKKASNASVQAENVRRQQQTLDSARQRRQIARNAATARANALAAGVASGSLFSSRTDGGLGSISSQEAEQTNVVNQAEKLGFSIFNLNQEISNARSDASQYGAVQDAGLKLAQGSQTIANVVSTVGSSISPSYSAPVSYDASQTITNGLI